MATLKAPSHIVIVGGSLAGLFAAVPLGRLGHKITILERSPVPLLHDQGAGVVAGSEALAWIRKFGRPEQEVENISVASKERLYLDRQGNIIDQETHTQRMTSWSVLYHLGRDSMNRVGEASSLNEAADISGTASYEYGRTVDRIEDCGEKVKIHFKRSRKGEETPSKSDSAENSITADFLIAADGSSSFCRGLLLDGKTSSSTRRYAGYVAFRGTVPEAEISQSAQDVFVERFTFYHQRGPHSQILAYTIPGSDGTCEAGKRLVNWVWYWNVDDESPEYTELMTDSDGKRHSFTLPTGGKMQPQVWQTQLQIAKNNLPPQFAEIVLKTEKPFVQAVTDLEPPNSTMRIGRLLGGKATIVGDALAGFRPHTAASTNQAAKHALMLEQVFSGDLTWNQYEAGALEYANGMQRHGVKLGDRSQFGNHPLAG